MKFNRRVILMEVMIVIECLTFKERHVAMKNGTEFKAVDNAYYLLSIFDAIMNTLTKANGKKIWMCKSMGMSQFHDLLLNFYGEERLRYIYLVRDPRDVCNSFMRTPVGDCHPYSIAKKWAKLQNAAARILHETPELIHQVCYEEVLGNKAKQVAKVVEFMGSRDVCRHMRRGSIVDIKSVEGMAQTARIGREAQSAQHLSYQFKNLGRGDSFTKGQFEKYKKEMTAENVLLVESVAWDEMCRLGYVPEAKEENRITFTDECIEAYTAENKRLVEKMNEDLAIENPDDFNRRQIQAAVLEKRVSEHYDEDFIKSYSIDIDDALDLIDDIQKKKQFLRRLSSNHVIDLKTWPRHASYVGFMPEAEVMKRFEIEDTRTLKLKGGLSVAFAAASQGGYYPSGKDKANQDAFISGSVVKNKKKNHGILFAVFDGHGPNGHVCSRAAKDYVEQEFIRGMQDSTVRDELDSSFSHVLKSSYHKSSLKLVNGDANVDASLSGTTAVSLFITKKYLHTANVGDSRCILIRDGDDGKKSLDVLTVDHTPDRKDEVSRVEAWGGVVMTSDQYDNFDPTLASFQQKRVWSKKGKWPGTAFTRSLGDSVAKKLGVVADPEYLSFPMPESDAKFVLGSDGIFDFIPDNEIIEVVEKYTDPQRACRELTGMAWNRWSSSEERTDDITVIVGHIKHREGKRGGIKSKFCCLF